MGVGFSTPVSLGVRASSIASTGFDALCAEQHELTWNDPTRLQQAEALEKIATALIARYDRVPDRFAFGIVNALDDGAAAANGGEALRAAGRRFRAKFVVERRAMGDEAQSKATVLALKDGRATGSLVPARDVGAAGNTVISLRSLATAIVEVAALASQGTVPWHIRRDGILAGVERRCIERHGR